MDQRYGQGAASLTRAVPGGAYNVATSMPDKRESAVDRETDRLNNALASARQLRYRAKEIADSYFGGGPESDEPGAPTPPISSRMEGLSRSVSELEETLAGLSIQLDRLSCI